MNNKLKKALKSSRVIIVAHIFASGPALELEEFLKLKVKSLLFIGHPFTFRRDKKTFFKLHKEGNLIIEDKLSLAPYTEPFIYIKEVFLTIYLAVKYARGFDYLIGSDNFSAYFGLILKRLGIVKNVILYTIDYVPNRFKNPLLNWLYHYFDRECLKNCKVIWNVSDKIAEARKESGRFINLKIAKQINVPLGIWYDRIPKVDFQKRNKNQLVFLGHILEKQGLQIVIKSLKQISEKISDVKLSIIGDGPYKRELEKLIKKEGVKKFVEFLGYIEDHKQIESILAHASLGIATYKPDPGSFTYNADPGKIKNYLAAGLPVVVTDVPAIAKIIDNNRCGVLVDYDENAVSKAVTGLLSNKINLVRYSNNAVKFAKKYDWNKIFSGALINSI